MYEKTKLEFIYPADEFSPIPFWFWNDKLENSEIIRQIHDFRSKGVTGFVIHPRIGIPDNIGYLSDEFMSYVLCAVKEAHSLNMKVILYDEGMYPSGSAHGMVVKRNPNHASKGLKITDRPEPEDTIIHISHDKKYCFVETFTQGTIRGIHFGEDDNEPEAPLSADLLNIDATRSFIELTHEKYYEVLKPYFGNTVIAMFTDEPNIIGRNHKKGVIPWTGGFFDRFLEAGNKPRDLLHLFVDLDETTIDVRKSYKKIINNALFENYYKPLYNWCDSHGIALTGHPHSSEDAGALKYFHIPGQDIVWRWVGPEDNKGIEGPDSTMAKCSSDTARHMGRRRNLNECFGCCGPEGEHWAFSISDMKWYLDWLFIRGVNMIIPHAFFYSVRGKGRYGERPPDVGPNNIWWKYYNKISGYIKRMSFLLTDSVNQTQIAILCSEDHLPYKSAKFFYQHQIEFNYLEESLFLDGSLRIENGFLLIESQKYKTIILEDAENLSRETIDKLDSFKGTGIKTIHYEDSNFINYFNSELFTPDTKDLRVSHIVKNDLHFYLLTNEGEETIEGTFVPDIPGIFQIWDPWEGIIIEDLYKNDVPVTLKRRSGIVICKTDKDDSLVSSKAKKSSSFPDLSWSKSFEGEESYTMTTSLYMDHIKDNEDVFIEIKDEEEIIHLYVNGNDAGYIMWAPYQFNITGSIRPGHNLIKAVVTKSIKHKYR